MHCIRNQDFADIGINIASSVPNIDKNFGDFLPLHALNNFYLEPIHNIHLVNTLIHLNKKTSKDINEISIPLLQYVVEYISLPLTHIFNLSVETGIFPDNMKTSKVTPLYKKSGANTVFNNYRGINI